MFAIPPHIFVTGRRFFNRRKRTASKAVSSSVLGVAAVGCVINTDVAILARSSEDSTTDVVADRGRCKLTASEAVSASVLGVAAVACVVDTDVAILASSSEDSTTDVVADRGRCRLTASKSSPHSRSL